MSALKTAAWTGAAVLAATLIPGASFVGGLFWGAATVFAGLRAWRSHKESQLEAAQEAHTQFVQTDRQRDRAMAIEQAYGNDRNTSVGWAEAEAGRGVGARGR